MSIVVVISFAYMFFIQYSKYFSRIVFIFTWLIGTVLMFLGRIALKSFIRNRMQYRMDKRKVIVITIQNIAEEIADEITHIPYRDYYIEGLILCGLDHIPESIKSLPVVSDEDAALDYLRKNIVDEVIFYFPKEMELPKTILEGCSEMGITIHVVMNQFNQLGGNQIIEQFAGYTVLTSTMRMATPRQLFVKRVIDIIGGVVGCLFCGILCIIVAPVIKIQSPGPVFFSQTRVGRSGRKFKLYKFRSMYVDAEEKKKQLMDQNEMDGLMFKMENDPRIFPFGKFIRKMSIDEFPQFWNVLRGDMSLVGTRPPTVDEYEKYSNHHKKRLVMKPGLTGMWQVSGRSEIKDFEEVVALDTKYIEEWDTGLDLRILWKTFCVVVRGKGSV